MAILDSSEELLRFGHHQDTVLGQKEGREDLGGQMSQSVRTSLVTNMEHLGTRATRENPNAPVIYEKRVREWPFDDADASDIEAEFSYLFPHKGDNFIDERLRKIGKPQVILDWGCGKGNAIDEFGEKYGEKVVALGYSMDSYGEWGDKKNAVLIQSTADDLFDILGKAGQSIDLIFSRAGMGYLFPGASSTEHVPMDRGVQYIRRLLDVMNDEGVIAFDVGQQQSKEVAQALRDELTGKAKVVIDEQNLEGDYHIYIIKLSLEELEQEARARDATRAGEIKSKLGL